MAILRKWTRCPRLAIIEFLNAVLLNVKPDIEPPEKLDYLLDLSAILDVDAGIGQDFVAVDSLLAPVVTSP
ncbi:hypothetical protein ACTJLB_32235 [Paraburkholderia sp. 22098]|uniref:hypothetical protein n=1 Tax=Paraburkholderia sp. 22098 TaxID=3453874 RepID=UPI003F860684